MTQSLKLKAETAEDIAVISAALQDAIVAVGDIHFTAKSRALTLRLVRFTHETDVAQRILTGLRIDGVLDVKSRGIDRTDPEAMTVLLSLTYESVKPKPSGRLIFVFAGGGELRVEVECLALILADVSEARYTSNVPLHGHEDV